MKKVISLILLLVSTQLVAQIEKDKALHFLGGNLFGLAGAGIAKEISNGNRFWTFAGAVGGSALVGVGKEAIDSREGGSGWSNGDLLATVLGGVTVGITIDLFTDHSSRRKTRPQGGLTTNNEDKIDLVLELKDGHLPSLTQLAMPELFSE